MPTTCNVGDAVVVVGQGPGRVASVDSERIVVTLSEGGVTINTQDAQSLLRPVAERATAERMLRRLCESCAGDRDLPELRSIRELARAPFERQVEYARWFFRRKKALRPKEAEIVSAVSELVLAEIAMSLGGDEASVRAAVKKGKPVVESRPARVLPKAPALADADFVQSFWLGGKAIVGEFPEEKQDIVDVAVKPGAWHAYVYDDGGEDDEALEGLLLLHADHCDARVADINIDVGAVNVEGGSIGVLDATALTDELFGVDEVRRLRSIGDGYAARGMHCTTDGDGEHRVRVNDRKAATGIFLPF